VNGKVTVCDTLDHQISGFLTAAVGARPSHLRASTAWLLVASLAVGLGRGVLQPASSTVPARARHTQSVAREAELFATIEKLAQLHAKGILSDEEFAAKKAELLSRL